jgi:hypothetical protein
MADAAAGAVWLSLLAVARDLVPLKADAFRTGKTSLIDAARASLANLSDRRCALEVLVWLEPEVTLALFDDIVRVAAHTQRDALLAGHLGLDSTLARIVARAFASPDPNIRDVGSDFAAISDGCSPVRPAP